MSVLIDAGPLEALLNRRAQHHRWAREQYNRITPPVYTCEAVIAEAYWLLQNVSRGRKKLRSLVGEGHVQIAFSYAEHTGRVNELLEKYDDADMDFADACLVRMVELERAPRVFTIDSDFFVYRVHRDQRIDLIYPAAR